MIRLLILLTTLFLVISCDNNISSTKNEPPKKVATDNQIIELWVKLVSDPDTMSKKLFHC